MLNLIISNNENAWTSSPFVMQKARCLTEYILPDLKEAYGSFTRQAIEELKTLPCIFAYEKYHKRDACIGYIRGITIRQTNIKIDFELTGETIKQNEFLGLNRLLDMSVWEQTRTHWTIKKVDLDDIKPYFSTELSQKPTVFISYSWTPISNQETVFTLISQLRSDGINVIYDKECLYPGQNINYFMEQALRDNKVDKIVVVCNKDYAEKANNRKGGVGHEAGIIISEIKSSPLQTRIIPVAVETDEQGKPYLPTALSEVYYIDLTHEYGYSELLAAIKHCVNKG